MRCNERMPDQDRYCVQPAEHGDVMDDCYCEETELDGEHTCLPCQNRHRALAAPEPVGFTREELTAATAKQQRVAPTKAEILDAINTHMLGMRRERVVQVLRAVEALFEGRGL